MEQLVLKVGGMTCTACENRIRCALGKLEGVRQARADHQAGEVRVVVDPAKTPETAVRACITDAGYEVSP